MRSIKYFLNTLIILKNILACLGTKSQRMNSSEATEWGLIVIIK
ncbi:hypothetical Protein YC6258_03675 [Gynuella sunshinyii YC6258]|uniref:Uncharacterized protein n=1 Tax=Gynuella sunshinyii YC6258 TaxID=1445510 RepID=A0A0C5VN33_9GAMM|nr:hypothetical Protein YC6258_03675 [Gynuella sunshinyii YC6258]